MNPRPLILIPWYGRWPDYLPLFLDGCRRNPEFEVCFFGEEPPRETLPTSIRFVRMSLEELGGRFAAATGVEGVRIASPYKLCDLKPMLGLALQDYLADREFWGVGDIDLTWGDLGRFASREVLDRVDIFCVRKEYVTGSFMLVRNKPLMNRLFMRSPDWQRVLESDRSFCFDECAYAWQELIAGVRYDELEVPIRSFSEVVFAAMEAGEVRGYFETVAAEWIHSRVDVTARGIVMARMAYALLHFVIIKKRKVFAYPNWKEVPVNYSLTPGGLFFRRGAGGLERLRTFPFGRIAGKVARKLRQRQG